MQTWDALRARRDVRARTDQPLDPADLERVLEAGWRAPAAKDRQARDFVLVTDREQRAGLPIGLGHPATRPLGAAVTLDRRPFAEVVHRGTW